MSISRKTRPDAKLLTLPDEQQKQLAAHLRKYGVSLEDGRAFVLKEFGISVSAQTVSEFYQEFRTKELRDQRRNSVLTATAIEQAAANEPVRLDVALIKQIGEIAFEMSVGEKPKTSDIYRLATICLKASAESEAKRQFDLSHAAKVKDQELAEKDLTLRVDKFQFDATKAAMKKLEELRAIQGDNSMDENAKLTAARQLLFGEVPDAS